MEPPNWANKLLDRVREDYDIVGRPEFTWANRRYGVKDPRSSSGSATKVKIHVTAGTSLIYQKTTVLHEIAHWIIGPEEMHSPKFWDFLWSLYRRYRIPIYDAFDTEIHMSEFMKSYFRTRKRDYTP